MRSTIHDIELPTEPLPEIVYWLMVIFMILLILLLVWLWRKYQNPIAKAQRQLKSLSDDPVNVNQLVHLLRRAGCEIPQSFDHARFAPMPCSLDTFLALKTEAKHILERAK